jgi:bla regulator protein blaR1
MALAAAIALQAQPPAAFAVVSIKGVAPGARGGPGPFVNTEPGRMMARGTLRFFIQYAYGVQDFQISGGPDWAGARRFDITATQPQGVTDFKLIPVMLQAALADRFALRLSRTTRGTSGYALVVAGTHRLKPSAADDVEETRGGRGGLTATRMTMRQLASTVSRATGRPVAERTGLTGQYNLSLTWTADNLDPNGVSIFTALQEQLGLKLESAQVPVEVLIIDNVETPSAD